MPFIARIAGATVAALAATLVLAATAGATLIGRVESPQGAKIVSVDQGSESVFDVLLTDGKLQFDGFELRAAKGCTSTSEVDQHVECPADGITSLDLRGGA